MPPGGGAVIDGAAAARAPAAAWRIAGLAVVSPAVAAGAVIEARASARRAAAPARGVRGAGDGPVRAAGGRAPAFETSGLGRTPCKKRGVRLFPPGVRPTATRACYGADLVKYVWINRGELDCFRLGRLIRILGDEVERVENGQSAPSGNAGLDACVPGKGAVPPPAPRVVAWPPGARPGAGGQRSPAPINPTVVADGRSRDVE